MIRKIAPGAMSALAALTAVAAAAPPEVKIPVGVRLPELDPLIAPCGDPAADRFLEIDISQRPPAGATRVQKVSGWVTADGVFHWPFVMRVRNIGDKPFAGKPGGQSVQVLEDDLLTGKKGRVVANVPFDRIDPRSGIAARFQFEAPAAAVNAQRFHRRYTLSITYKKLDSAIVSGQFGDCDLQNNNFAIEIDGRRKGWIFAK